MSLFDELKRRNVFRVGIAYLVLGWVLLQVTGAVVPILQLPDWVARFVLLMLLIGFPLVLIFAWAFELTPEGIRREKDVDRTKSVTSQTGRKLDYTIIAILAVAVVMLLADRFYGTESAEKGPDTFSSAEKATIAANEVENVSGPISAAAGNGFGGAAKPKSEAH